MSPRLDRVVDEIRRRRKIPLDSNGLTSCEADDFEFVAGGPEDSDEFTFSLNRRLSIYKEDEMVSLTPTNNNYINVPYFRLRDSPV